MVLHVVVGSGAAGCVAAVSLLEGGHDVLLIERGPFRGWEPRAYGAADCTCSDEGTRGSTLHTAPISWGDAAYSGDSAHSVQHDTAPQAGLSRRVVVYPQGRGLGGSMGVNAMIWSAGHRAVFDDLWPVGWGSDTIDRLLLDVRGICGLHPIKAGGHVADVLRAVAAGGCSPLRPGLSAWESESELRTEYLSTTDSRGQRTHPLSWLEAALSKRGAGRLCVLANTAVERVLVQPTGQVLEGGRARGLLLRGSGGGLMALLLRDAASEVLLCAGALQSPLVLLASQQPLSAAEEEAEVVADCSTDNMFSKKRMCVNAAHDRLFVHACIEDAVACDALPPRRAAGRGVLPAGVVPSALPVGARLQDHALLPVLFLNVSNVLAVCLNALLWIYNTMAFIDYLQIGYIPLSEASTKPALTGVHGWVNVGPAGRPQPLKLCFLDGRVATSMAGQLLPTVRPDPPPWWWGCVSGARPSITMVLQVLLRLRFVRYLLEHCVVAVLVCLVQPESEGAIRRDPSGMTIPDPRYLSCERDRKLLHEGVFAARRLVAAARAGPHATPVLAEVLPGPLFLGESAAALYSSLYTTSFFHVSGSCGMPRRGGPPADGVVDERLCVRGCAGLRVADCSVFPAMPCCPTAATAMAVGRRAAELVMEDCGPSALKEATEVPSNC